MHKKIALFIFAAVTAMSSSLASAGYFDPCVMCNIEFNNCNGHPDANQETCEQNYLNCLQACGSAIP